MPNLKYLHIPYGAIQTRCKYFDGMLKARSRFGHAHWESTALKKQRDTFFQVVRHLRRESVPSLVSASSPRHSLFKFTRVFTGLSTCVDITFFFRP